MKRTECVCLVLILAIAAVLRLYGLSWAPPGLALDEALVGVIALFGHSLLALRIASAVVGFCMLIGVYALARRMFDDWRMAAMSTYLMAIGFVPLILSRIALPIVLAPLCATLMFFELYKGIETHRIWHWAAAGFLLGIGFYTTPLFVVMPLAVIATLAGYWISLHAVFSHDKYHFARHQMLGGATAMISTAIIVYLPTLFVNTSEWFGQAGAQWQFGIMGQPLLFWPVLTLFVVGLLRTLWKFMLSWKKRGHPGIVHTLLLSWLIAGLLPFVWFASPVSFALRLILALPAVYLISGLGLHWLAVWLERWYGQSSRPHSAFIVTFAVLSFLFALTIADGMRVFNQWALAPETAATFNAPTMQIVQRLNDLPPATLKYVVINDTMPIIMYLTDTATPEKQREHNIYYLTPQQFARHQYPRGAVVIQLEP